MSFIIIVAAIGFFALIAWIYLAFFDKDSNPTLHILNLIELSF